jgi:integrase
MPIKLISPSKARRTPYFSGRGTHRGIYVDRSTKSTSRREAKTIIDGWEREIERGEYGKADIAPVVEAKRETTFTDAALAYLKADGDPSYIGTITDYEGEHAIRDLPISEIDQVTIDNCAAAIYPNAPAATRNRNFYTPVSAILKRAGNSMEIKRPVGWRGKKSQSWLEPEQAFPLIDNCYRIDPEFGLLCLTYLYTGERLSEPLRSHLRDLKLDVRVNGKPTPLLYIPDSKNGEPRPVHLPPILVAAFRNQPPRLARPRKTEGAALENGAAGRSQADAGVPFLQRDPGAKLFRFHVGGHLRDMLAEAMKKTGLRFPRREGGFHIFCHTYGTWMTRYGGLDTEGLVRTKRWKNAESAARYAHTVASYEAMQADVLPTPPSGLSVDFLSPVKKVK